MQSLLSIRIVSKLAHYSVSEPFTCAAASAAAEIQPKKLVNYAVKKKKTLSSSGGSAGVKRSGLKTGLSVLEPSKVLSVTFRNATKGQALWKTA